MVIDFKIIRKSFERRGQATWIAQIMIGFMAIGIVAFLYFLMYGRYFDIHAIVRSNEAKRHVINMAQVMLSSDKLVLEESFDDGSKRFYRGVFDKEKLDAQLINQALYNSGNYDDQGEELIKEISYPNTGTRIVISDVETEESWILAYGSPGLEYLSEYIKCMYSNIDLKIFSLAFNPGPWNVWDKRDCYYTYVEKIGVFGQEFPVMIYDDGEMHEGRLFLRVMEL